MITRQLPQANVSPRPQGRYATLLQNMAEGFLLCEAIHDAEGRLVDYRLRYANPAFVARAPPGHVVGRRQLEIRPGTTAAWFSACQRALDGHAVRFEFEDPLDGRWYEVHMTRLSDVRFGQFFVDVTARKAAERRQMELFSELNHRVKNNLAITCAVLELQARQSGAGLREALTKAADRIRSVAELHAALYQQNSLELVDLEPYLRSLGARFSETVLAETGVRLAVSCPPLPVSMSDAVNIGLIANELVTNAAKHAFRHTPHPAITLTVAADAALLRLVVRDNGRGFDPGRRTAGLGLRLVRSLVEGFGGTLSIRHHKGTVVEIVRPLTAPRQTGEDHRPL